MRIGDNADLNVSFSHFLTFLLRPEEVDKLIGNFDRLIVEVIFLDDLNVFLPLSIWDGEFNPIFIGI